MPTSKDSPKDRLARYRQIKISMIGRKSGRTIHSGSYSWFPGDDEPPNVVIIRLVYETILATDDLETCLANFRFNQLWPKFVMLSLSLTRLSASGSWTMVYDDQSATRLQGLEQMIEDRFWLREFMISVRYQHPVYHASWEPWVIRVSMYDVNVVLVSQE